MENFYEELYQYLIERGIDDDEATEVVNYLYEDNIHEYELLTENRGRAFFKYAQSSGIYVWCPQKTWCQTSSKASYT